MRVQCSDNWRLGERARELALSRRPQTMGKRFRVCTGSVSMFWEERLCSPTRARAAAAGAQGWYWRHRPAAGFSVDSIQCKTTYLSLPRRVFACAMCAAHTLDFQRAGAEWERQRENWPCGDRRPNPSAFVPQTPNGVVLYVISMQVCARLCFALYCAGRTQSLFA